MVALDLDSDSIGQIPEMLDHAVRGADVVFAKNLDAPKQPLLYRFSAGVFNRIYKLFNGVNLSEDAPKFRVVSKAVVNYVLRFPQPAMAYRHLPATSGFSRHVVNYRNSVTRAKRKVLHSDMDQGLGMLVSTTRMPMRVVTSLSLFGAVANILYSMYVVTVAMFQRDIEPGWVSLSLQQSGMFFLLSLVLLILGEYILVMTSASTAGPSYHIAEEHTSARLLRKDRLNIESVEDRPEHHRVGK